MGGKYSCGVQVFVMHWNYPLQGHRQLTLLSLVGSSSRGEDEDVFVVRFFVANLGFVDFFGMIHREGRGEGERIACARDSPRCCWWRTNTCVMLRELQSVGEKTQWPWCEGSSPKDAIPFILSLSRSPQSS